MAGGIGAMIWARLIAALVVLLTLGSAVTLALHADAIAFGPADLSALRFTVVQAGLSALAATALAVPLSRALFRRRFAGRSVLIRVLAAPFVLPVVVAVLGLLAVFGRAGPVNEAFCALGLPPVSIYGLHGVVLANVFLNLPLACRLLLHGWQAIPAERFRLAQALGMGPAAQFRHLEWPMLRAQIPGIAASVFLICLTSFAIALMLGGGPRASTLELAIYQSLRFEADLGRAALLACLQFALCGGVTFLAFRLTRAEGFGAGLTPLFTPPAPSGWRRPADIAVIFLAGAFLLTPLIATTARGLPGLPDLPSAVWPALARSIAVALVSAAMATGAALTLALAVATGRHPLAEVAAMLPMAASGLVLGTGMFLILRPIVAPEMVALPLTALVNAALALPFVFRAVLPQARRMLADHDRLSRSLGLAPRARFRLITLPLLARPLGFGAGLAAAFSMGDLGVITLFADEQGATLPMVIQRLIGAYRMDQAAAASLVLVAASFALLWSFDHWGQRHADA